LTLVNVNQVEPRTVTVQGGAYGEHQIREVVIAGKTNSVNGRFFSLRLAPGSGAELIVRDTRYANQPTMAMPWYGDLTPAAWAN
jgi:hypothetical protein